MKNMTTKMKYAALLVTGLLLAACQDKPAPAPASAVAPASAPAAPAAEDFSKITNRLEGVAFGGVDAINGEVLKAGATVFVQGDKIEIAGNYVDAVKGAAAAGVVVMIGGKPFTATYGGERPDIAKAHNNPKYLKSQFYLEVPASAIDKGTQELSVHVIASDRSGYYDSGVVAKIDLQ